MSREKCQSCNKLVEYHGETCDPDDVRRHTANKRRKANAYAHENRKAWEDVVRSCGLVKVRGALGGIYWE